MKTSSIKALLPYDIRAVWDAVTSFDRYQWRSDISRVEILNETEFIEYTPTGYATTFTVTNTEPLCRWEFDLENSNLRGHWAGIFTEKDGQTEIEFTETVTAKKFILNLLIKSYLKKQQALYLSDLKKALA